jgi:hypothetical protein
MSLAAGALAVAGGLLLAAPLALASSGGPPSRLASGSAHLGSHDPRHSFGRSTSTNWSGYAVPGTGATHVIGTWIEPAVTCSPGENSWSSPWVGIDGNTSNTVEQIGGDSDCQNGTPVYYAWYEMYPKSLVSLSMAVHPGDSLTGEVTYTSSGAFILKLTNNTTSVPFQTTQNAKNARRTSVEWITEGPSSGLLSDFGSMSFSAASATINNQTGSVGSFTTAQPITMVTKQGIVRAAPTNASHASFGVAWQHG